eukprot:CAMPEP_0174934214 /NCGR_PEP_ID=MMETSP1355-20121228/48738_1 /TAXON_ID=464990 /ORGANISM="Hemiselmis tepida, Strain CCMP443" /LENGTH=154 /DNA_ID=CAMNT_0016180791 /DNA_START=200 /DNA_END=664 /DNA_ORIENTATION=+
MRQKPSGKHQKCSRAEASNKHPARCVTRYAVLLLQNKLSVWIIQLDVLKVYTLGGKHLYAVLHSVRHENLPDSTHCYSIWKLKLSNPVPHTPQGPHKAESRVQQLHLHHVVLVHDEHVAVGRDCNTGGLLKPTLGRLRAVLRFDAHNRPVPLKH